MQPVVPALLQAQPKSSDVNLPSSPWLGHAPVEREKRVRTHEADKGN